MNYRYVHIAFYIKSAFGTEMLKYLLLTFIITSNIEVPVQATIFNAHNHDVEVFIKGETEYLFITGRYFHMYAKQICSEYNAQLVSIYNLEEAKFLADAISQADANFDTLWTSGMKKRVNGKFVWQWGEDKRNISKDILKLIVKPNIIGYYKRYCMGFGRSIHDKPQLRPINCYVNRALICSRSIKVPHEFPINSIHPNWIVIGTRSYKIFGEYVNHQTAASRCLEHDLNARLAVIADYETSQILGKYLLIGRPSLENAWIEAKWADGEYQYISERKVRIPNEKNHNTKFPPWRTNQMQKGGGCLLLDRHLANISYFVESRCERFRPYICYKLQKMNQLPYHDIYIDNNGYRLYLVRRSWEEAYEICQRIDTNLAEPSTKSLIKELLFVMAENVTAYHHMWIGGKMISKGNKMSWVWSSNGNEIEFGDLPWIKNKTYHHLAESNNLCLNMDRENHKVALIYGAFCKYPQFFVCATTKEHLWHLEKIENETFEKGTTPDFDTSEVADESNIPTITDTNEEFFTTPNQNDENTYTTQLDFSSTELDNSKLVKLRFPYEDIFINNSGYRLYYYKKSWNESEKICQQLNMQLVEPKTLKLINELIFVMSKMFAKIVWLGGKIQEAWIWESNKEPIKFDYFQFTKNDNFSEFTNQNGFCLSAELIEDNEIVPYKVTCGKMQEFICATTKQNLIEIEKKEKRTEIIKHPLTKLNKELVYFTTEDTFEEYAD